MRLIDANNTQKVFDNISLHFMESGRTELASAMGYAAEVIGRQRTVDAAEVVRCRGCKSYDGDCGYCEAMGFTCKPDDFCSYGERKTDG